MMLSFLKKWSIIVDIVWILLYHDFKLLVVVIDFLNFNYKKI